MIVDGRAIADDILTTLRTRRTAISTPIALGIIVGSVDSVIESFVRTKVKVATDLGIEIIRKDLELGAGTEDAMMAVRQFDSRADALIVQLPLPAEIDTNAVLTEIPKSKDVDAINPIVNDDSRLVQAPVAVAVMEILARAGVDPRGKRTVVVGAGRLVGSPTAGLLKKAGADLSMFTLDSGRIEDLKEADIIVLGAGNPHFIKPEHIRDGVVIIDAGASESAGVIQGDADPACAKKASLFTPVPGGVGPVAIAMLFKNLLDLVDQSTNIKARP